jgi:small conductance mechanosensitive channel
MDTTMIIDKAQEIALEYGPRIITAIIIWLVGVWVIRILSAKVGKMIAKRNIDDTLKPFLQGLISALLKVMLIISLLGTLGIQMTSFVAIIGAVGLAVGMALSGTLQNFAGGVMILIFKPFNVGDFIEAKGFKGTVKEIQIFNTILKTGDNRTIIIPNGNLSNSAMINFSTEPKRRVDWVFGIGYGDNYDKAKDHILQLCEGDERILKDTPVFVALSELADSSVNITVRAWVKASDYWSVYFELNEKAYKSFESQGLNIPFPQMDIHMHKTD